MIKKLCLILISAVALNAASFNQRIAYIIGFGEFNENRGLIEHLFSNKSEFLKNGSMNYIAVMEKLKENGLLKVGLNSPKKVSITFLISHDPIKSMKIISDSLKSLGYYHYFTKELVYDESKNIIWTINLKTGAAIDPLMLSKKLATNNCQFDDIRNEGYTKWIYSIDTSRSTLSKAKQLIAGEKVDFRKPLKPYFIKIDRASSLYVASKPGNQWFPQIVFYDVHLNILDIVKEDNSKSSLSLRVPEETRYIKIDDIYTLANIKRGLSVMIKE